MHARFALLLLPAACMPVTGGMSADNAAGELSVRPAAPAQSGAAGLHPLRGGALLYVPAGIDLTRPAPLVVMLHGAGGSGRNSLSLVKDDADRHGFILLAPNSRAASWDIISARRYGPDVTELDAALGQVFASYRIDPKRLALAGFSDGASYALSIGLTNGALFSHLIAFSPGFMAPSRWNGTPHVFISHGIADRVLPIDTCSRRIVPAIKRAGLRVDYREFPGGHVVPAELADAAFDELVDSS